MQNKGISWHLMTNGAQNIYSRILDNNLFQKKQICPWVLLPQMITTEGLRIGKEEREWERCLLGTPETRRNGRRTRKALRALTSNPPGFPLMWWASPGLWENCSRMTLKRLWGKQNEIRGFPTKKGHSNSNSSKLLSPTYTAFILYRSVFKSVRQQVTIGRK